MSGYRPQQYNNAPRPQSLRLGPYCLTTELTGCPLRTANMLFLLQLMTSGALRDCCATLAIPVMLFATAEAFEDHGDFEDALCVLLDINLNDNRSGIDLRLGLKAAGYSVPVIYMTGNDHPTVRRAALESGCLAYLTKPFSASSLIELLERASARMT